MIYTFKYVINVIDDRQNSEFQEILFIFSLEKFDVDTHEL